jgi:effector-binding domain-containing protein
MLIYHHVVDEESEGDIEVCVPVRSAEPSNPEVTVRELEAGELAVTEHRGPYDELAPAYHVLTAWICANGYGLVGPPREVYVNDPRTVKPEALVTRIEFPVCGDGQKPC